MTPDRRQRIDEVLARRQPDLCLVAENLHKPRNFSAVVRSCDAVGVMDVHAVYEGSQPPQHWHTCQGAIKWVEVHSHPSVREACEGLKSEGLQLVRRIFPGRRLIIASWTTRCPRPCWWAPSCSGSAMRRSPGPTGKSAFP